VKNRRKRFKYKSATAELSIWGGNHATVFALHAAKKHRGHATHVLDEITAYADKHGLRLHILAEAYGKRTFKSNEELAKFYARFGFKETPNQAIRMARKRKK